MCENAGTIVKQKIVRLTGRFMTQLNTPISWICVASLHEEIIGETHLVRFSETKTKLVFRSADSIRYERRLLTVVL